MKIAIIGYSGSGKSTLAAFLGDLYGLPVLHLDKVQFLPGWVVRPEEEKRALVEAFLEENKEGWVIDGTYSKLFAERRFTEADRIVFLNFSRLACLSRVLRRYRDHRGTVRDSSAEGCPEKIDREFLCWVLLGGRTKKHRARFRSIQDTYQEKVRVIRNQRALTAYYQACTKEVKGE